MNWDRVVDAAIRPSWVGSLATTVQDAVAVVYAGLGPAGQSIQDLLHGIWLGHPLHPVLTDLPIGSWTIALTLDTLEALSGRQELGAGADVAVTVGLAGALSAAAAGLTDWYRLRGSRTQRVGMVHALFNVSAATLYGGSLLLRRSGLRGAGRALALAGYAAMTAGAYLGGDLVFALQVGTDHARNEPQPEKFAAVMPEADLTEDQMRRVEVGEAAVLLVRHGGLLYALADTCSHMGCSLAEGQLEDSSIRCNCHGSRFALADGRVEDGPATYWQPAYRVRIRNGQIEVGKRR